MITRVPYRSHSEFLAKRRELQGRGKKGVFRLGSSEISTIYRQGDKIGLNRYTSPTVFFMEACDFHKPEDRHSLEMTRGTIQEHTVYQEYWRHTDPEHPTPEAFLENYHGQKKVFRTARRSGYIYLNDKLPWMFASPDYIISANKFTRRGPLEVKAPSSRDSDMYEGGIATAYVIQNYNQMMVMGFDYGELFALVDATYPRLFQFDHNDNIYNNIIDSAQDFHDRVLRGKKIVHSRMSYDEKNQALSEIAPKDDGNPLYTDYLKEKHRPENAKLTAQGDSEQLSLVVEYLTQKSGIKEDTRSLLEKENRIREWFTTGIGYIEWPGVGRIGWIEKLNIPTSILEKVGG